MTYLEYLAIRGIRSFSTEDEQKIKFFKPLTLIVGSNGCGKTTIIECLNAGSSGQLPPGADRGRLWVHDPRVSGESVVKAQIRLQFSNFVKKKIVVCRSYQLKQKSPTKVEFKQLDASIKTMDANREVQSASHRCGEVDKLVPQLMGVSKAMLESVVFCHQTEITWPLSESKKLKEKFDAIFASTRYSKALKNIKEVQKHHNTKLRQYRKDMELFQEQCEQLEIIVNEQTILKEKITRLEKKIKHVKVEIQKVEEDIEKYDEKLVVIQELQTKIVACESEVSMMHQNYLEAADQITDRFNGSDEELQKIADTYEEKLQVAKDKKAEKERIYRRLEKTLKKNEENHRKLQTKSGILEDMQRQFQNNVNEASQSSRRLALHYDIPCNESVGDLSVDALEQIVTHLEELCDKRRRMTEERRKRNNDEEQGYQSKITERREKISGIERDKVRNLKKIQGFKKEMARLEKKMKKTKISDDDMGSAEREVREMQRKEKEKKREFNLEEMDENMLKIQNIIEKCNGRAEEFQKQIEAREKERAASLRLEDTKREYEELQAESRKLFDSVMSSVGEIIREEFDDEEDAMEELENRVNSILGEVERIVKKVERRKQKVEKEISSAQTKMEIEKKNLKKSTKQEKVLQKSIEKLVPRGKEYKEYLASVEKDENDLQSRFSDLKSLSKCWENFVTHAKENHACQVCERDFENDEEENEFVENTKEKLKQSPRMLEMWEEQLTELQKKRKKLVGLASKITDIHELQDEIIPDAKDKIKKLEDKLKKLESDKQTIVAEINDENSKLEKLRNSSSDAKSLSRNLKKTESVMLKVEEAEKRMAEVASEGVSFEQLKKRLKKTQAESSEKNKTLEKLRKEYRENQKEMEEFKKDIEDAKERLNELKVKQEKFNGLKDQLEQIEKEIGELEKDNRIQATSQPDLLREIESLSEKLEELVEEHKRKQKTDSDEINKLVSDYQEFRTKMITIKKYVTTNKEESLIGTRQQLDKLGVVIEKNKSELDDAQKEWTTCRESIMDQEKTRVSVRENLAFRKKKKEWKKKKKELKALKKRMENHTGNQESVDARSMDNKRKTYQSLKQNLSRYEGEIQIHKDRVKENVKKKKKKKYERIHDRYRSVLIKSKIAKATFDDIEKYHAALESALMNFHELKIREINTIIKELWQKTYRGADIDTIEIRADKEGGMRSKRKGSYQYRVVMLKGNVPLDMRGRCSAGQRILACLIIRLALSEAFCLNFGVLTLDEPVQNLDVNNMHAFADSLKEIISERQKQHNFQLVVITHNEEFAARLGSNDFVSHYYRISKDPNTQHSRINKLAFSERT